MDSSKVHQRRHRGRHHGARYGARHLGAACIGQGRRGARYGARGRARYGARWFRSGSGKAAERRADTARDLEEMDDAQAVLEEQSGAQRPVACPHAARDVPARGACCCCSLRRCSRRRCRRRCCCRPRRRARVHGTWAPWWAPRWAPWWAPMRSSRRSPTSRRSCAGPRWSCSRRRARVRPCPDDKG